MYVKVRYPDDSLELVRPSLLQYLIETEKIREFERQDGWVVIGVDPVRCTRPKIYSGPERRKVSFCR